MLGHEKKLLKLLNLWKAESEWKSYLLKEENNYKWWYAVCEQLRLWEMIIVRVRGCAELIQWKYDQFGGTVQWTKGKIYQVQLKYLNGTNWKEEWDYVIGYCTYYSDQDNLLAVVYCIVEERIPMCQQKPPTNIFKQLKSIHRQLLLDLSWKYILYIFINFICHV